MYICFLIQVEPYCIALYDLVGEEAEDLSFNSGDRIVLTARLNEEWLKGRLHGKEGSFPAAYVEVKQDLQGKHWPQYHSS